jgi:hypothetical protein
MPARPRSPPAERPQSCRRSSCRTAALEPILRAVFDRAFRWGFQAIPPGALDYIKYPVTVDGSRFVEATKFRCLFELEEIFQSVVR